MGLDITAYRSLFAAPNAKLDEDGYPVEWNAFVRLKDMADASDDHWPGRSEGIPAAPVCGFAESFGFRAGSYGGYNQWRNELAKLAGFNGAQAFWETASPDAPFYELINFSDCEGVIGPKAAAELSKDFAAHEPHDAFGGWFAANYADWKRAFDMASEGGAVVFR